MPMLMPACSGSRNREKPCRPAIHRRARIGECIDANAEPGDGVRTGDTDEAEKQNREYFTAVDVCSGAITAPCSCPPPAAGTQNRHHDRGNKDPQDQNELALCLR